MKLKSALVGFLALFTVALTSVVFAQERVRAYVLAELTQDADSQAVRDALGSLSNCKALAESLAPGEVIVHVECQGRENLTRVLAEQIPAVDGRRARHRVAGAHGRLVFPDAFNLQSRSP